MDYPGNLFVIAAPSGAGKSSLTKALLHRDPTLHVSVSHTTRKPRGQEQDGRDYWFISRQQFLDMIDRNEFIEWAEVHGNFYGTSRGAVQREMENGTDVVLEIDYQGALQIKKIFPNAHLIFILPPSWQELESRLRGRGEDEPEVIAQRMINARKEVAQAPLFDFVIINAQFEKALDDLAAVVHAQRQRFAAHARSHRDVFLNLNLLT
jgi:guanylate kinase